MTISGFRRSLGARRGARAAHRTTRQTAIVRRPRRDVVFRRPFSKDNHNDVTNSHNWCYNDVTNSHNSCCEITFTLCREGALMKESSAGILEDTCSRERPPRRLDRLRLAKAAPEPEGGCTRHTSLATCQRRQLRLPGHRSRAQPCLRVLLDRASRLPSVAARPHSRSRASTPTASAEGVAVTSWSRG